MQVVQILEANRAEWARCAKAMYANGRNAAGHKLSVAATKRELPVADFDAVAAIYRAWLVFNEFPSVPQ